MDSPTDLSRVLVVDDERELADVYTHWIAANTPHTVRTDYDGTQALERLDGVDVVLLDRRLPDSRGADVLEAKEDRDRDCRIAMVIALEPDVDIVDMPFDEYLTKPVRRDELLDTIERLRHRSAYHALARQHFSLLWKRAVLDARKPIGELETSEEFQDLHRRIARTREDIDDLLGELDDDDLRRLFADIQDPSRPDAGRGTLS
jgi:DNA-binding NtrC family response regulator